MSGKFRKAEHPELLLNMPNSGIGQMVDVLLTVEQVDSEISAKDPINYDVALTSEYAQWLYGTGEEAAKQGITNFGEFAPKIQDHLYLPRGGFDNSSDVRRWASAFSTFMEFAMRRHSHSFNEADMKTMAVLRTTAQTVTAYMEKDLMNHVLFWTLHEFRKNSSPIYRMTEDLASALVKTPYPYPTVQLDPRKCIPISGMYISVPPIFEIGSIQDEGRYSIEGLYLTEDYARHREEDSAGEPMFHIIAVGEDKAKGSWYDRRSSAIERIDNPCRDDSIFYCTASQGRDVDLIAHDGAGGLVNIAGCEEVVNLALSFLHLYTHSMDQVIHTKVPEAKIGGSARTQRRKLETLNKKGRTTSGYTVLDLCGSSRSSSRAPSALNGTKVKAHMVAGHFHHYWMLTDNVPEGKVPVRTQTVKGKAHALVAKWTRPYRKGVGPTQPKDVKVR